MMFKAISQQNPGRFSGCSCSNSTTNELQTQFQDHNLLLCCGLYTQVWAVFFPSCGSLRSSTDPFSCQFSSLQFEARNLVHIPCLVISSGQAGWEAGEPRGAVGRPWGWGCESVHCTDDLPLNRNLLKCNTQNQIVLFVDEACQGEFVRGRLWTLKFHLSRWNLSSES